MESGFSYTHLNRESGYLPLGKPAVLLRRPNPAHPTFAEDNRIQNGFTTALSQMDQIYFHVFDWYLRLLGYVEGR
jgi:hypothetical protein